MPTNDDNSNDEDGLSIDASVNEAEDSLSEDTPEKQDEPTINLTLSDLGDLSEENVDDIKENTGIIDTSKVYDELGDDGGMFDVTSTDLGFGQGASGGELTLDGASESAADVGAMMDSLAQGNLLDDGGDGKLPDMPMPTGIHEQSAPSDNATVMLDLDDMGIDETAEHESETVTRYQETENQGYLTVENLEQEGDSFILADGYINKVGREIGDIVISHRSISSSHCTFTNQGGIISITDNGSTNGTFINGEKIRPRRMVILEPEDQIQLGQVVLSLKIPLEERSTSSNKTEVMDPGLAPAGSNLNLEQSDSSITLQQATDTSIGDLPPFEQSDADSTLDEFDTEQAQEMTSTDLLKLQANEEIGEATVTERKEFNLDEHLRTPKDLENTNLSDVDILKKDDHKENEENEKPIEQRNLNSSQVFKTNTFESKAKTNVFSSEESVSLFFRIWSTLGDALIAVLVFRLLIGSELLNTLNLSLILKLDPILKGVGQEQLLKDLPLTSILLCFLMFAVLRVVSTLLIGVSVFQFLTGITAIGSFAKVRFLGAAREIINVFIFPLYFTAITEKITFQRLSMRGGAMKFLSFLIVPLLCFMIFIMPYAGEFFNSTTQQVQQMRVRSLEDLAFSSEFNSKDMHFRTKYPKGSKEFYSIPLFRVISKNKKTRFIPGVAVYNESKKKTSFLYLVKKNNLRNIIFKAKRRSFGYGKSFQSLKTMESSKTLLKPDSAVQVGERLLDETIQQNIEQLFSESIGFNRDKFIDKLVGADLSFSFLVNFRNILFKEFDANENSSFYLSKIGDTKFVIIQNRSGQGVKGNLVEYLIPVDSVNGYIYKAVTKAGKGDVLALRDLYKNLLSKAEFESDSIMREVTANSLGENEKFEDVGHIMDNLKTTIDSRDIIKVFSSFDEYLKLVSASLDKVSDKENLKKELEEPIKLLSNYMTFLRSKNKDIDNYLTKNAFTSIDDYFQPLWEEE